MRVGSKSAGLLSLVALLWIGGCRSQAPAPAAPGTQPCLEGDYAPPPRVPLQ